MSQTVTRTALQALLASGQSLTLVDALPESYYLQQHLPGAINLVEADVNALAAELLPDRSATVVTYCSNPSCQNSKAVARRLEALGYTDVRVYADGIQDWVEAGNPVEARSLASPSRRQGELSGSSSGDLSAARRSRSR
jgi:rhodanese-related sulfurtransferase